MHKLTKPIFHILQEISELKLEEEDDETFYKAFLVIIKSKKLFELIGKLLNLKLYQSDAYMTERHN